MFTQPTPVGSGRIMHDPARFIISKRINRPFWGVSMLLLGLCFSVNLFAQVPPDRIDPDCNCVSNDINEVKVFVSKDQQGNPLESDDCEGGEEQDAYVTFDLTLNANTRPGAFAQIVYTLNNGEELVTEACFAQVFTSTNARLTLPLPNYQCGDKVTLVSTFFAWGNGNSQDKADAFCAMASTCEKYSPKCKYETENLPVVEAPLIADFNVDARCDVPPYGTPQIVTLTGEATGGVGPYIYQWDINNDGIYDYTGDTYSPQLAIGNYTIKVQVTDSKGNTDTHELPISIQSCVLPVKYSYVKASATGEGAVQIEWQTTEEVNSSFFETEKSKDGKTFRAFGNRISAPITETLGLKTYKANDFTPFTGTTYYRLKQVDTDGTISFTKIISVNTGDPNMRLKLTPNPVRDHLKIELDALESGNYTVQIIDASGRIRLSANGTVQGRRIIHQTDTRELNAGIYFVNVKVGDQYYIKRMVK